MLCEVEWISSKVLCDDEVKALVIGEVGKDRTPRERICHRACFVGNGSKDVIGFVSEVRRRKVASLVAM